MDRESLIDKYPTLFHMAEDGSWPSIQERGLLSTQALVDLYEPEEATREAILGIRRIDQIRLSHPGMRDVVVRDQRPLSQIDSKLTLGTSLQSFLDALNSKVFFWLTTERLMRMIYAKAYREQPHIVLHISTQALIAAYGEQIKLCRMNSGAAFQSNHPARGPEIFESIAAYETHPVIGGKKTAKWPVELTVPYAVPDIARYVTSVRRWQPGRFDPEPVFTTAS